MARVAEGIYERHARACPATDGGDCRCDPSYQAQIYSAREHKRISRTWSSFAEARTWRQDALVALRRGTLRPSRQVTLQQAAHEWLEGAKAGVIRNRSGDVYKPSVLRSYEHSLRARVLPKLGPVLLQDLRRSDIQRFVGELLIEKKNRGRKQSDQTLDPSTIRNTLMPLRAIYRHALALDEVAVNPTAGVQLPAVRGTRDGFVSPEGAAKRIEALSYPYRALWAATFYAGLRRGELQALEVADVNLADGMIHVRRSWDQVEGAIAPKSRSAERNVPIAAVLRDYLDEHLLRLRRKHGLAFGRSAKLPFNADTPNRHAARVWKKAELEVITLHDARHTFASLMIAAGVNAKALCTFMGHSSITVTLDRYGHLFPGSEAEAADLLDTYLQRANTAARVAAVSDGSPPAQDRQERHWVSGVRQPP